MGAELALQLIPGLVVSIGQIVAMMRDDSMTPEQRAAQLDAIEKRLDETMKAVQAAQLPNAGSNNP
jgi:hypothetical protein